MTGPQINAREDARRAIARVLESLERNHGVQVQRLDFEVARIEGCRQVCRVELDCESVDEGREWV